jgi:kynurenine formamidase
MQIFDLSHTLEINMPVYPGTPQPDIRGLASFHKDGFRETFIGITSHTGTHIDAPYHMIENGKKADQLPLDTFTGRAGVIRVPAGEKYIGGEVILNAGIDLEEIDFLLFCTGWSKYWGSSEYFHDFPVLSKDTIELLISLNLKGVGFDTISPDKEEGSDWPVHYALLGNDMIIIENLKISEGVPSAGTLFCFPLPYMEGDGSPVRAVLIV